MGGVARARGGQGEGGRREEEKRRLRGGQEEEGKRRARGGQEDSLLLSVCPPVRLSARLSACLLACLTVDSRNHPSTSVAGVGNIAA